MAEERLREQLRAVAARLGAPADVEVQLERPRNPEHGDLATNLAMTLAKALGRPPRQLAEALVQGLDPAAAGLASAEVAGPGFINFRLAASSVADSLEAILAADADYGRAEEGAGERVVVEWVSANPTGPIHFGHGRQAALGDAVCNLLERTGWSVHREYYYNDSGRQMELLARSVWARYQQLLGAEAAIPEGGYHGEYVLELAERFRDEAGERFRGDDSAQALDTMRRFAVKLLRAEQDRDLADFRVRFDEHYLESSLYEEGRVERTIQALQDTGLTYEHEGALWLRTTAFGDQKDRVMVRGNGQPTYFLPDVAYHMVKWERGFRHAINVQGADHHGTVPRVHAGLRALGLPEGYPEYVLHQMVRLERGGEEVKISKRAGGYTTLRELYEMVGVDVARYFFLMRKPDAHLVFDLDQALDQSEKNPVFKVQYAHARMCSIFGRAGVALDEPLDADPGRLGEEVELELIKQLAEFPGAVETAARLRAPHLLCDYLERTAGAVNSWYHAGNPSRNPELAVLVEDAQLRTARLALARGVRIVLKNGLALLGLTAPERMAREQEAAA
ncbi:MAG TPA: arginine--tRNA ligase [Longimicrobiales bacterium]|nr:arginine--tRNA ligase [Longimicrobiales bacterium]